MSADLTWLVLSAALALVQMLVAVFAAIPQVGLPALAGNREGMAPLTGLALRAQRAHLNMLESLLVFAIVVLAAAVADRSNDTTALGAAIFFWARLAHAIVYLIGIPWLRTAVWAVSVAGILIVFTQLF